MQHVGLDERGGRRRSRKHAVGEIETDGAIAIALQLSDRDFRPARQIEHRCPRRGAGLVPPRAGAIPTSIPNVMTRFTRS